MAFSFNKICSNLIPVGKYKVNVTDVSFRTKPTGEASKDIGIRYTIVDGPHKNKTVLDTIFEKSFSFRLKPWLQACGIDCGREFATQEELYAYAMKQAKGKTIMVDIVIKTYNGKEYNNISNFYPLPGSKVSAEEVVAEMEGKPVDVKTPAEPQVAVNDDDDDGIKDDDLPF